MVWRCTTDLFFIFLFSSILTEALVLKCFFASGAVVDCNLDTFYFFP